MTTRYADSEGYVTPQTVAYYAERARGGTGLIIFEATYPCEPHPDRHLLIDDSYIEGLASVTDAVHEEGARIAAQLNISRGATDKHDPVVPSLSAVDTELLPVPVDDLRELTTAEIETLIQDCADGAVRAQQAGFDAVEIHAASGYLLHLFFSPVTNHRTDRYGGSLEDRTRIAREVIKSIRARTNEEFPIWFRISGDEFMPGGIDEQEAAAIANELEGAGSAAVHVTAGHNWNRDASMGLLTAYEDRGLYAGLAAAVRTEVDVPVIAVGRINDPVVADDIITAGDADLVAMGRAHIADPHFARKAEAGDLEKIRRCVGGLEGCRDMSLGGNQGITCTVNPRAGHETQEDFTPVDDAKDITIIGGGPAGMEAARVAARRGHSVTLFERDQQLGGQLTIAKHTATKHEHETLLSYYRAWLADLAVEVRLGVEAGPQIIVETNPDEVVVAVGSSTPVPTIEGLSDAAMRGEVLTVSDLIEDHAIEPGRPYLVYGGTEQACDAAMHVALSGGDAIVLVPGDKELLPMRSKYTRTGILSRMADQDVTIIENSRVQRIDTGSVTVFHAGESETSTLDCKFVVLADEQNPNRFSTTGIDVPVHRIGDAAGVRGLYPAIHEAYDLANSL